MHSREPQTERARCSFWDPTAVLIDLTYSEQNEKTRPGIISGRFIEFSLSAGKAIDSTSLVSSTAVYHNTSLKRKSVEAHRQKAFADKRRHQNIARQVASSGYVTIDLASCDLMNLPTTVKMLAP
jgi:hypothetical protein